MTGWDPVVLFSIILVSGALVSATYLVVKQVKATAKEIEHVRKQCDRLSGALRTLARESLRLCYVRLEEVAREERLREECEGIEHAVSAIRRNASPLVVLDERKAMGDGLWQVPVARTTSDPAHPTAPWRTFLVWAPSADRARRRVLMRYADAAGLVVGEARERADFPSPAS